MRYFMVVLFLLTFWGCEKKEDIKVGVVFGLSGSYSDISKQVKNGVELAVDEINKNGGINGRKISLIIRDNKGDINLTKKIDKELINQKVPVIIGHITSSLSKAVVPLFNNSKTILFSPTSSTTDLSNLDDNFIRTRPAEDFNSVKKLVNYIKQYNKNINAIYDANNKAYALSIVNAVKNSKILNLKTSMGVTSFDLDYKLLAQKLKGYPLFLIGSTQQNANIVKNLRINGFKNLIVTNNSSFSPKFIEITGKYSEGIVFPANFNPLSQKRKFLEFKRNFADKFGREATSFDANGYETMMILKTALSKKDIKSNLINKEFDGLQGKVFINKFGDVKRDIYLFMIHNVDFLEIK